MLLYKEVMPSWEPHYREVWLLGLGRYFRATLDGGSMVQIPRNQFGFIWSKLKPKTLPLDPSLHLGSPNHELSFV